ncbi:MAG: FAD-dependent oxidoreductase, partial [Candidatus Methylomirabilales bacterium]
MADGRTLTGGRVLVTSGASPWAPPIPGLAEAGYLDNERARALQQLPASLVVIGASVVGLELAQLFARLGVRVTVLEALPRVVPAEDPAVGEALAGFLEAEGLAVHSGIAIVQVGRGGEGYEVRFRQGAEPMVATAEQLLVATGRRANT